jgi:hypothetical protein
VYDADLVVVKSWYFSLEGEKWSFLISRLCWLFVLLEIGVCMFLKSSAKRGLADKMFVIVKVSGAVHEDQENVSLNINDRLGGKFKLNVGQFVDVSDFKRFSRVGTLIGWSGVFSKARTTH